MNNLPDIMMMEESLKTAYLIDVAILSNNMLNTYQEKKGEYWKFANRNAANMTTSENISLQV